MPHDVITICTASYCDKMEPLLLFSLFITHLAVGGELLQFSTDVVYVSDDGIDDSSCLNGGSHCKTLGYVLTNIPMLQCSNCTVMVTYDHIVGPFNNSTSYYTVNISNVEVLYIVGLGQPSLYFNGSGLLLINNDNITSVVIENVILNDCYIKEIGSCIWTLGFFSTYINYYLLNFTVTNVMLYNAYSICVVAQGIYWQHSNIYDSVFGGLWVTPPGIQSSEIEVMNSTFQNITNFCVVGIQLFHGHLRSLSNVSILIRQCQFFNVSAASISLTNYNDHNYFINLIVDECTFYNNTGGISIDTQRYIAGRILITNNCFKNNLYSFSATFSDNKPTDECHNNIMISCSGNIFIDNIHDIVNMVNWAFIEIKDSIFINNTVDDSVISIEYNYGDNACFLTFINIIMKELSFIDNNIASFPTADDGAIVTFQKEYSSSASVKVSLSNLNFTSNTGTPLSLDWYGTVSITGNMTFIGNNAMTGGGMYINSGCVLALADNATISFINNTASYGSAIYVDQGDCFISENYRDGSIIFNRNHASKRPLIYTTNDWCSSSNAGCVAIQNTTSIVSLPTNILFNSNNKTSVFPGQTIVGDVTISDCFGNASLCLADVHLLCGGRTCDSYDLQGPSTIFLSNGTVNTGLSLTTVSTFINGVLDNPQIQFLCKSPTGQLPLVLPIDITVLPCPLGFLFNSVTGVCECVTTRGHDHFICNRDMGVACIREDYWYGSFGNGSIIINKCVNLFCNYSGPICPSVVSPNSANYVLLDSSQCLDGHGGTLCTGCAHNKLPTYGALQCIDGDKCAKWHPYVLLLLNTVIPFIDGVFLIIVIRLKLSIGSGYLYGPLFYLAVLNLIPFTSYNMLNKIVSFYVSTFLLKLEILGYMPWCLFRSVSLLTSKWFELIAPSVVAVVLLLTVYLARCSPKLVGRIQQSPLQAMCLLVFVLFWSLASTAISVITPVYLSGVEGAKVHLQPDLPYLSGGHIPLWIISVMILLVLYSIVFVLTFSRFLNLHRLKPVLDEFQSCYRDRYRWYGGLYFIVWTVLQILIVTSNYQLFHTSVIILTVTHCLLQPYCIKWLNMIDGFLLGGLSITSSLVLVDVTAYVSKSAKVIVYMSVILPLCFISLGVVSIVLVRFRLTCISKVKGFVNAFEAMKISSSKGQSIAVSRPQNVITRSTVTINAGNLSQPSSGDSHYREPLLLYLQESASYNATDN